MLSRIGVSGGAYLALQIANEQLAKSLASLVAVTDILESLGGILAGDIEQNLLTTAGEWKTQKVSNWSFFKVSRPFEGSQKKKKKRRGIAVDGLAGKGR